MSVTVYVWVLPGRPVPPGYRATGVVSRWPHTGEVGSELYVCEVSQ